MEKLTAEQANELGVQFLGLAQVIGNYRFNNWNKLSAPNKERLGDMQWSILNAAEDILAFSTVLVMEDVQGALSQIAGITTRIRDTVNDLAKVQKVINIAASVVSLAAAIVSLSPQGIIDGIDGLAGTLSA